MRLNRRDGRVVEGARLESVYRGNSIEGSNPSLSATLGWLHGLYAAQGGRPAADIPHFLPSHFGELLAMYINA